MLGKSWDRIANSGADPRVYLPTTSWAIHCIPQFMSFIVKDVIEEQISVKEAHDRYFWPFEPDRYSAFTVINL